MSAAVAVTIAAAAMKPATTNAVQCFTGSLQMLLAAKDQHEPPPTRATRLPAPVARATAVALYKKRRTPDCAPDPVLACVRSTRSGTAASLRRSPSPFYDC